MDISEADIMKLAEQDKLDRRFTVIFTSAQIHALRAVSNSRKISISTIVRTAVLEYCQKRFPEFNREYIEYMEQAILLSNMKRG